MLLTLTLTTAVWHSFGVRPETMYSGAASITRLGQVVAHATNVDAFESLESLQVAADIVNSIMLQAGNATEHMSDDDVAILNSVLSLLEESMYGSMDSSHQADQAAIQAALAANDQCNKDIAARLGEGGDLDQLYQGVLSYQNALTDLQGDVDAKTQANATKFADLQRHIDLVGDSPDCDSFPVDPTKNKFDVFFDSSEYVNWYTSQQTAYVPVKEAAEAADSDIEDALLAYQVGLAQRNVNYCDWKLELEKGCLAFDQCYQSEQDAYLNDLKPALEQDMQARMDAFKAGETIIAQITFLLGESADSAPPTNIDASRYVLDFPPVSEKGSCELEVLDDEIWVPTVSCQTGLSSVGKGVCQTPLGRTGDIEVHAGLSEASCQALCLQMSSCLAVTFHGQTGKCEVHTTFADHVEPIEAESGLSCWAKDLSFTLIGRGWCRTPDGGVGQYTIERRQTEGSCLALCAEDPTCVAVEYHELKKGECEVHHAHVDHFSPHGEGRCWVKM